VGKLDLQGHARLGDVLGGEVRAVVDVKALEDAADRPARVLLAARIAWRKASAVWIAQGAVVDRA